MRALFALFQDFCVQRLKERRKEELMLLANILIGINHPAGTEFLKQALSL